MQYIYIFMYRFMRALSCSWIQFRPNMGKRSFHLQRPDSRPCRTWLDSMVIVTKHFRPGRPNQTEVVLRGPRPSRFHKDTMTAFKDHLMTPKSLSHSKIHYTLRDTLI